MSAYTQDYNIFGYRQIQGSPTNVNGGGAQPNEVGAEQQGVDVGRPRRDARAAPQVIPPVLGVRAGLSVLFPQGDNAAVCSGVKILPENIIDGFDAVVEALKDMPAIQDASKIKGSLGKLSNVCGRVLDNIKAADEREDKRFPDETEISVDNAEDSAAELYRWAEGIVLDTLGSSGAMTKQAMLQVVPFIVALAYAARIRITTRLVGRDMTSQESDKETHLDRACKIVDRVITLLQKSLGVLMANASLLELVLDYELPMAIYLTLMMRFRVSVDAIKSPTTRPEKIAEWDDGLSSIREVIHWKPSGAGDQGEASPIELRNLEESLWWVRFTDTNYRDITASDLKTRIYVREIGLELGDENDQLADKLALKPGKKSALLQLSPASDLRAALYAKIAQICQATAHSDHPWQSLEDIERICAPPEPDHTPLIAAAPRTLSGHSDRIKCVAVCANGERVLSSSWDSTMRVWSLVTCQQLHTFFNYSHVILCVAMSSDGKKAASGSTDNKVRMFSLETGNEKCTLCLEGHNDCVRGVTLSPDGRTIASGSDDKTVKLWDTHNGQCKATLTENSDCVNSVAFSPDGCTLVSGSKDKKITVWRMDPCVLKHTIIGHCNAVTSVAVTHNGLSLVSRSDNTIKVWSLKSGKEEKRLIEENTHNTCLAIIPDGERIALGNRDNTVQVWNLRTRAIEVMCIGHTSCVECLSVSADGRSIVSGSRDNTIRMWRLSRKPTGGGGDNSLER